MRHLQIDSDSACRAEGQVIVSPAVRQVNSSKIPLPPIFKIYVASIIKCAKLITPLLSNHAPMIAEAFSGAIEACEHMLLNEPHDEDASAHKP